MNSQDLHEIVLNAVDDLKAREVLSLDVSPLTTVTDFMVICSGTSERHVKSIANEIIKQAKNVKQRPMSIQGLEAGQWVLVDLGGVIAHVMLPEVREFYQLEKLWQDPKLNEQSANS